jgi:hypothetical protein
MLAVTGVAITSPFKTGAAEREISSAPRAVNVAPERALTFQRDGPIKIKNSKPFNPALRGREGCHEKEKRDDSVLGGTPAVKATGVFFCQAAETGQIRHPLV